MALLRARGRTYFLVLAMASLLLRPCPCSSSSSSPSPSSSSSLLLQSDALILASLKHSLHTPTQALDTWDTDNPGTVCSWCGIHCDGGRVSSLDLSSMNLSGSFPNVKFSNLDALINLTLVNNNLQGEIRLSNMTNLRYLNISGNQFTGNVDWDYTTLPSLEVFDAYDNNFTSRLPPNIIHARRLRVLELGGNFFFGEIPPSYGQLAALEYLSVYGNDLRGKIPPELGNITGLKQLYLGSFNVFEGGIPAELGNLSNLNHLDLSNCGLDGWIPKELGRLQSLDTLFLHTNLLSGPIPPSLGNLTGLVALDLSNNALTGELPRELAGLRRLTLLNLFMNRLHGPVPDYLASLPQLTTLGLFMNNFTGTIPARLGSTAAIEVLDLSSNRLTGMIPQGFCSGGKLRVLILLKNFLFGPIPESLGRCSTLVRVRLGQNYINGSIPAGFLYLPRLDLVELHSNYLSGTLTESPRSTSSGGDETNDAVTTPSLSQLNLSNNLLMGPIPASISNLTNLQELLLGSNRFEGSIPDGIGGLKRLTKLDLSNNAMSGSITPAIAQCTQMAYLDLSGNQLSGPIPPAIANLAVLNYLNLSRNHLDGGIPAVVGAMKGLTAADFSFNNLSGKVPDTGQFAYLNASSFTGNPLLCGSLLSNPCDDLAESSYYDRHHNDDETTSNRRYNKVVLALALLTSCLALAAAAAAIRARAINQRRRHREAASEWKLTSFCGHVGFTVTDVLGCMKDGNVIGRGGGGVVYQCRTTTGEEVAVKRLLRHGSQINDHREHDGFRAEVRTLGRIRHRNIVRLLAFCSNSETNVLVYEYMRNGSLGEALHGPRGKVDGGSVGAGAGAGGGAHVLGWGVRYRIAVEAARGLCYLHHDCRPMIVHRDVKSGNILLDSRFEAHVADFGLAKFFRGGGASECMSAIAGSYGYIAPEYAYTLRVDEKSDVYSYGVVLLELLTGKRPVGEFGDGVDIVQWTRAVTGCKSSNAKLIVDHRLGGAVPSDEAAHVFFVAMLCVQDSSVERPTMREVVQMLSEYPRHLSAGQTPLPGTSPSPAAPPAAAAVAATAQWPIPGDCDIKKTQLRQNTQQQQK